MFADKVRIFAKAGDSGHGKRSDAVILVANIVPWKWWAQYYTFDKQDARQDSSYATKDEQDSRYI